MIYRNPPPPVQKRISFDHLSLFFADFRNERLSTVLIMLYVFDMYTDNRKGYGGDLYDLN